MVAIEDVPPYQIWNEVCYQQLLFLCNLQDIVKVFIGYILLKLNLQDSKALARQRKLSALVDNNFSRRLRLNSGI